MAHDDTNCGTVTYTITPDASYSGVPNWTASEKKISIDFAAMGTLP